MSIGNTDPTKPPKPHCPSCDGKKEGEYQVAEAIDPKKYYGITATGPKGQSLYMQSPGYLVNGNTAYMGARGITNIQIQLLPGVVK